MNFRRLVKAFIPRKFFRMIEPYGHLLEAILFNIIYGFPARGLKVIGVTGTNGKTTTAFLIHKMLHEAGYSVGLMTTVAYGAGDNIQPQLQHITTLPTPQLLKRIKSLKGQGVRWLVLETTSHALAQHRVWGVPYNMAVMTNITHEHLDYHGTFERYLGAKRQLFVITSRNRKGLKLGIVNADDPSAAVFTGAIKHSLTYGITNGDLKAKDVKLKGDSLQYKAVIDKDEYSISCRLPGKFNVYNSLAAVAVGRALGLDKQQIELGIASLDGVRGRMTSFSAKDGYTVIVDFAHTPDALENVLKSSKEATAGKLALVFGATGDRDKLKRPVMGEVAAKNADKIYLTDDETYTEDPATIIGSVFEGIKKAGGASKTAIINDRLSAIKTALKDAQKGDTVLITGMGHQVTRNMGGVETDWDEIKIVQKLLSS